ncbi:5-hydroxytryptamine receptor 3A-like [Carassius carassius]|uniref:5-hydroxytryptamine receptor 3A-like n=1 Tax=Carassius carassius TaxID=217509 RepID=UPI00286938D6|nr:5-hydroxytryptamine receptor 3A-like [Carassius carassius]
MGLPHRISLFLLLCSSPLVFVGGVSNSTEALCDRRCLANARVEKELFSAPQDDNCTMVVNITSIQYETLSFDTKGMEMSSRIKVNMEWKDPDLGWMQEKPRFPTIVLPVDKIWIPQIVLDNAIETTVEPYTNDVQVRRDGTVSHAVVMFTTVSCQINLFNYPFVTGSCPVAINGWSQKTCALNFQISDNVTLVGGSRGEWLTTSVNKTVDASNRVYLLVALSINPFSAFVTLILPSALILLADLVSFALPFEGGERNSFKVTLVLSFTMFLLILSDHLPNSGHCSPLLHYHFSFCLVCLVMSMLASIVLTRLSVEDSFLVCRRSAKVHPSNSSKTNDGLDQEKGIR